MIKNIIRKKALKRNRKNVVFATGAFIFPDANVKADPV
jgi:hypothetical protein